MQSIPFNYISYFSFQIKNCKGKTERLKLGVFDAFRGGCFLFVFLPCVSKAISCALWPTVPQWRIPLFLTLLLSPSSLKKAPWRRQGAWWLSLHGSLARVALGWCWWRWGGCCAHPWRVPAAQLCWLLPRSWHCPCTQGNHQPGNCVAVIELAVAL